MLEQDVYDPLGDEISNVELLDYMGNDVMVVNSARVSMGKWQEDFDPEKDVGLLNYMAHSEPTAHFSPFCHPQVQFRIRVPVFVARQWTRSNIGTTRNEESRRYVDDAPMFYVPKQDSWRKRPEKSIKQGSGEGFTLPTRASGRVNSFMDSAIRLYEHLLEDGVAPEMARMILPQNMYVTWIETGSLYFWYHFVLQRSDSHAQWEIQQYAWAIDQIMSELFPASWSALRSRQ